jgi:hypothetical protein
MHATDSIITLLAIAKATTLAAREQHLRKDTHIFLAVHDIFFRFLRSTVLITCCKQLTCFCTSATLSLCLAGAFSLVQYTQQYLALRYSSKAALRGSRKNKQKNHLWCVMPHSSSAPPFSTCPAILNTAANECQSRSGSFRPVFSLFTSPLGDHYLERIKVKLLHSSS